MLSAVDLQSAMNSLHHRLGNAEGSVSPLVFRLRSAQAEHAWFVLEDAADCSLAQTPKLGDLPDRIVLLVGDIEGDRRFIGRHLVGY